MERKGLGFSKRNRIGMQLSKGKGDYIIVEIMDIFCCKIVFIQSEDEWKGAGYEEHKALLWTNKYWINWHKVEEEASLYY